MDYLAIKSEMQEKVLKTLEALKKDFSGLRTGRASAALLEGIMVEAYGGISPITQVASISVPDSRLLSVQVWDKGLLKHVEKAIIEAGLGLNPVNDGSLIRVPIPTLTEERRIELTKIAAKYAETARISVRNLRREAMDNIKSLKNKNLISEDEQKRYETEIQKLTDSGISDIDEELKRKDSEIKQV